MVDESGLAQTTAEVSKSGYDAIKRLEGLFYSQDRVPPPENAVGFGGKPAKDRAKIVLKEVVILEMSDNEPEPELRDDTFTIYIPYAIPGKKNPHPNSFYTKGWVASFEQYGKKPADLVGQRIVLERKSVVLFQQRNEEGELVDQTAEGLVYSPEAGGDPKELKEHVRKLCLGKTPKMAARDILLDKRAKVSEFLAAAREGTLAEKLDLELDESGKFKEAK